MNSLPVIAYKFEVFSTPDFSTRFNNHSALNETEQGLSQKGNPIFATKYLTVEAFENRRLQIVIECAKIDIKGIHFLNNCKNTPKMHHANVSQHAVSSEPLTPNF